MFSLVGKADLHKNFEKGQIGYIKCESKVKIICLGKQRLWCQLQMKEMALISALSNVDAPEGAAGLR